MATVRALDGVLFENVQNRHERFMSVMKRS